MSERNSASLGPPPRYIALFGRGLHSGEPCGVCLERTDGPVTFFSGGAMATRDELRVVRTDHGVAVESAHGFRADLVEHLFAVLSACSITHGLAIELRGPEVPILDGGAGDLVRAVRALAPPRAERQLRITRHALLEIGDSRYEFLPGDSARVEVSIRFDRAGIGPQHATWDGSERAFAEHIAPARTFGFAGDGARLRAAGRARGVDPTVVIVFREDGSVVEPGPPPGDDELARHKLLDLLGDAYLFGGPPTGTIRAHKPGHGATKRALERAVAAGVLARRGTGERR